MSVRLLRLCRRDLKVRTGAKAVLYVLADHADDDGVTWIAEEALVTAAQTSRSALYRSLDDLRTAGLVRRERVSGRRVWRVTLPEEVPPVGQVAKPTSPTNGTEKSHQRDLEVPLAGPEASVKPQEAPEGEAVLPLGLAAPEPKPKRTRTARPSTHLPEDFALTDDLRRVAREEGMAEGEMAYEFRKFRIQYLDKPVLRRDWRLTWRKWCVKAPEFKNNSNGNNNNNNEPNTGRFAKVHYT